MKVRIDWSDPDEMVFRKRYHKHDPRPNITVSVRTEGNREDAIKRGLALIDENTLVLVPKSSLG